MIYLVVGRICDSEDNIKLVSADSEKEASEKFEKYVRGEEGIDDRDFYIEHCDLITNMEKTMII